VDLLNAADAALALASRELAALPDWTPVVDGSVRSALIDAPLPGVRAIPGGSTIDVPRLTNELTCARSTPCSDARVRAVTAERPWGRNNPRWQPFVYTPLEAVVTLAGAPPVYVVVWLGDDPLEADDDPQTDGGGALHEGRFVVRARVAAFGAGGARRALEADLRRVCTDAADPATCLPGIRVQSWRAGDVPLP
jgi:hypothetical protein